MRKSVMMCVSVCVGKAEGQGSKAGLPRGYDLRRNCKETHIHTDRREAVVFTFRKSCFTPIPLPALGRSLEHPPLHLGTRVLASPWPPSLHATALPTSGVQCEMSSRWPNNTACGVGESRGLIPTPPPSNGAPHRIVTKCCPPFFFLPPP